MKILAVNGSPRGENSLTQIMVEEFLAGAAEAGAEVESVFLADRKVGHCRACFACWVATPGECAVKDDMVELLGKVREADVIVYATPLYTDVVTGLMKDFMDRTIPLLDPHFAVDERGESRHPLRYERFPKLVVVSNSGFPEQSQFQVLSLLFRRLARNFHSEVIAEIYRGGGGILGMEAAQLEPLLAGYKALLQQAGREIAKNLKLSDETREALGRDLVPPEMYSAQVNRMLDLQLEGKP